ncbi:SDR family NAD(P)-dependent oxidoreductase [Rhodococcus sp. NPDC019627]|uniref:SDR family NAD(P)-dependent oxidoreductase n=1 Tax=unclassified Rhodococcus (in: high G+C Gram-positive bacteria) TaxID=192944 RepID=UPI0033DE80CB
MTQECGRSHDGPSLSGHVILVTGASSGLGHHAAQALSHAGANVVLTARNSEPLCELAAGLPSAALVVPGDLTDEEHRKHLISAAHERFGRIDGLVNYAAAARVQPALRESTTDFDEIIQINLVAPFALARDAAAAMREQNIAGSIINISSVVGIIPVSWQPNASYAAAKSGLIGLTKDLASQWARYGIRVNSIAPGPFVTGMSGSEYVEGEGAERMRSAVPLGRMGRIDELDGLVKLLMHSSSSFITGQTIAVDGGLSISL